jgi:5-hydroxyisourate hydrolase
VLDTARGRPAKGVRATIAVADGATFTDLGSGETDADGRITDLLAPGSLKTGSYRITFDTGAWYEAQRVASFYPRVVVDFVITALDQHYHVPLLLSPFGYSTYRGS